ncbi:hypothetical protein LCGC14_3093740, partial [marine sediment metagenome]
DNPLDPVGPDDQPTKPSPSFPYGEVYKGKDGDLLQFRRIVSSDETVAVITTQDSDPDGCGAIDLSVTGTIVNAQNICGCEGSVPIEDNPVDPVGPDDQPTKPSPSFPYGEVYKGKDNDLLQFRRIVSSDETVSIITTQDSDPDGCGAIDLSVNGSSIGICLTTSSDQTLSADRFIGLGSQSGSFTAVSLVLGADRTFTALTFTTKGTGGMWSGGDSVKATVYKNGVATALTVTITAAENNASPPVFCKKFSTNVAMEGCDEFAVFVEPSGVGALQVAAAISSM